MPSTFIKDFKMVKSKSEPKTEEISPVSDPAPRPASGYKKFLVRLILWIIFLAVMLGLWLNPEIIYNSAQYLKNQTAPQTEGAVTFNNLQTQVAELRNKVMNLGAALRNSQALPADTKAFSQINQRINTFEKQQLNALENKADNAALVSLTARLDKIEQRLDNMAKIPDQAALILSAAMMIKDSAARGQNYAYEAELLSQLASKEPGLTVPVQKLASLSSQHIPNEKQLTSSFRSVFKKIEKTEKEKLVDGKNWKQRLNMKLQEYVQIKHTNPQNSEESSPKEQTDIFALALNDVNQEKFAQAVNLLTLPENQSRVNAYPELVDWISQARTHIEFQQALKQISTYSLALMKLNYIKKEPLTE